VVEYSATIDDGDADAFLAEVDHPLKNVDGLKARQPVDVFNCENASSFDFSSVDPSDETSQASCVA
jgi:hypothetical protein